MLLANLFNWWIRGTWIFGAWNGQPYSKNILYQESCVNGLLQISSKFQDGLLQKKQVSINSSCERLLTLKIPTYELNASTTAVFYGMNKEFCNQSYTLNIFTNFVQKIKMMHTYCLKNFRSYSKVHLYV